MLLIAITRPEFYDHEAERIMHLLSNGFDYVHIRKPGASIEQVERLVRSIAPEFHARLKLHDAFELVDRYNIGGVHLNRRNPQAPATKCKLSRSCHSIDEMNDELARGVYEYITLSPIFDSISKPGYRSQFDLQELANHVQGKSVIALGGVTRERLPELEAAGFMGAAMMGAAWLI